MSRCSQRSFGRQVAGITGLLWAAACGGTQSAKEAPSAPVPAAEPAEAQAAAVAPASEEPTSVGVPDKCAPGKAECLPGDAWTRKLCENVYPEVALYMFRQGTPWQRLYLRGRTEAINASGGATVAGFLEFDEEVLVLRHRAADAKGIQIGSGDGQYDALRWDGSCVSLEGEEVTSKVPPKPKHSRVEWRWLGEKMRDTLRSDASLADTYRARQKECKGVTIGDVSKQCEKLDAQLIQKIVDYVHTHSDLPAPSEQP
jgi:hypothetical protein